MDNYFTLKCTIDIPITNEQWKDILVESEGYDPDDAANWDRRDLEDLIDEAFANGNLTEYIKSILPQYKYHKLSRGWDWEV